MTRRWSTGRDYIVIPTQFLLPFPASSFICKYSLLSKRASTRVYSNMPYYVSLVINDVLEEDDIQLGLFLTENHNGSHWPGYQTGDSHSFQPSYVEMLLIIPFINIHSRECSKSQVKLPTNPLSFKSCKLQQ